MRSQQLFEIRMPALITRLKTSHVMLIIYFIFSFCIHTLFRIRVAHAYAQGKLFGILKCESLFERIKPHTAVHVGIEIHCETNG